jgi:hypothetical protein
LTQSAFEAPVFHLEPHGNLGNRMIQLMVAMKFASLVPRCRISNVELPEWGMTHSSVEVTGWDIRITSLHRIDMESLATKMNAGEFQRVIYSGYGQRMENFLPVDVYRDAFRPPTKDHLGFDEHHLVCPVRAGDVLNGTYPEYVLTPVEFYAELAAETGLKLVFMGQTTPNLYTDRLREAFPDALFLSSMGAISDFEMIRQSRNIVVCVSTFVWLAAWLSHADRIFMAANGLFNPMQYNEGMLLPFGDSRYEFHLFPFNLAVPLSQHARVHARIAPWWRLMRPDLLERHVNDAPRVPCTLDIMMPLFNPAFYLAEYPGVGEVMGFTPDNARFHYQHHGIHERRLPFRIDPYWYAEQYPLAAFEVGQGDYRDLPHHFAAIGHKRGYRPHP